ncbi:hypothetical protein Pcinc_007862 [Petrolisthes cinctipes]|uniref:Uncharacterized protein n=1 Tax=Petrolisthes cinctipes TaxID=88211 RepID=A0AAE1G8H7_PETCI|nr:hypothetical protein Pcinc_007862 [Petrolisthes cinctipes]
MAYNTRNSSSATKNINLEKINQSIILNIEGGCDINEVNHLLGSLTGESQALVKVLTKIFSVQISGLSQEVIGLQNRIQELKTNQDNLDQYQRRDTVIIKGPALPQESTNDHTASIVVTTIKDNQKININPNDISVTNRLGPQKQQRNRSFIVKFLNRSLKHDLIDACVSLRPQLYINESLTPKRESLFSPILTIRKTHKHKFQQCYTIEGNIVIKLRNTTVKHTINDDKRLMSFLEKYPEMMDN